MTGRSRFRFRFRGVMSLVKSIASQFFDILQKEEASSNTNVFYDPADLSSLFDGRKAEAQSTTVEGNPSVGDVVGTMMDTSQMGGKTADEYIAENAISVTGLAQGALNLGNFTQDYSDSLASSFSVGDYIVIKFTISNYTSGTLQVGTGNQNTTTNRAFNNVSGNGTFYKLWKATAQNIAHRTAGSGFVGTFNIDVVAKIPGHHAIAPSDSARPVLFDDPDLTAAALTDNGQRGEELVTDSWSLAAGWSEDADTLTATAANGTNASQSPLLVAGNEYEIQFEVLEVTNGNVLPRLTGSTPVNGTAVTSVGTYSQKVVANSTTSGFAFLGQGSFSGIVSNISVRKVLTAFDERGAELYSDGDQILEGVGGAASFNATPITVEIGATYQLSGLITGNSTAHRVKASGVNVGAVDYFQISSAGNWQKTIVATSATLYLQFADQDSVDGNQSIHTNISVKKVPYPNLVSNGTFDTDSDWNKGTGWSIGSGVASRTGAGNSNLYTTNAISIVENRWYFVQFYVSAYTSGQVRPIVGSGGVGTSVSSTGWHSEYIRCSGSSYLFMQGLSFEGSIDNVSIQELPAGIDRKYYLDTDGSDDWMEVKPTLNLGEQWWHVGAWQSDTSGKYVFATTSSFQGGLRHASSLWKWRNAADTGLETLINFDPTTLQVVTVEQAGTNSISGRANGANSAGVITPYDDSGDTQGLALFSSENDRFNGGLDGRFYGGSWGQGQVDYDELTVLQDYLGTTTQPPIDPPDVTEYADVYELLSAQTGAVLFDIDDTTSLRTVNAVTGNYEIPVDGDPVNLMLDVSDTGGATVAAATAARPELADTSSVDVNVGSATVVNSQSISLSSGTLYEIVVTISNYVSGNVRLEFKSGQNTNYFSSSTSFVFTPGAGGNVQLRTSGAAQMTVSYSIKEISSHAAIAPSDSARPTLASVLDTTASELTDDGTRTEISAEYHAASGTLPTGLAEGEYIIRRSSDGSQQWWYKSPESRQGGNLGRTYEITYTVSEDSTEAGSLGEMETEAGRVNINTTVGTHTITAVSNGNELRFIARVGHSYKISNVSYKRVNTVFDERGPELVTNGGFDTDSDWVPPAGASISNGTAILENVSTGQQVYQSYALPAGVYEYTFDLVSITSGAIQPYIHGAGVAGTVRASAGTYTELLVVPTAGSRIAFRSNGTTSAVVDNISVKQVPYPNLVTNGTFDTDSDWTKGTGWSIGSGVATNAGGNTAFTQTLSGLTSNAWYMVRYYVGNATAGVKHNTGSVIESENTYRTAAGWYTEFGRATATSGDLAFWGGNGAQLDNVSVQEVSASVARAFYLDFDGSDDNLILDADTIAASSNATLYKTFRGDTTDAQQKMFAPDVGPYILAAHSGSTATLITSGVGSPVFREDGSIASYATRDDVFTALIDNTDHTIGVEEADLSADSDWTTEGFYIGGERDATWNSTGRLYAWAAVDTRLDGRGRDLLENFMIGKKTS